jgi:hypothetical protein
MEKASLGYPNQEQNIEVDISRLKVGADDMIIDGRVLRANDRIYDLLDVVAEPDSSSPASNQEIIVIDGRIYERVTKTKKAFPGEDTSASALHLGLHDEIMAAVMKIAENIVKEQVPVIAERLIREEIEKIKGETPSARGN